MVGKVADAILLVVSVLLLLFPICLGSRRGGGPFAVHARSSSPHLSSSPAASRGNGSDLSASINAWRLHSGRRMACGPSMSRGAQRRVRLFLRSWKRMLVKWDDKIAFLDKRLQAFSEENSMPERDIVNPLSRNASLTQKLGEIRKLTEVNLPLLRAAVGRMDAALGTHSRVNVKSEHSIAGKARRPSVLRRRPWMGVEHLRDTLRFMTAVTDIGQVADCMAMMVKKEGLKLVKVDTAKLVRPGKWGWRFVAFDLRMPNGQIVEYYVTFRRMAAVMWDTHRMYERWRQSELMNNENAQQHNGRYMHDEQRSRACYTEAFIMSLKDGQYTMASFFQRWLSTMQRMHATLAFGVVMPDTTSHNVTTTAKSSNHHRDLVMLLQGDSSVLIVAVFVVVIVLSTIPCIVLRMCGRRSLASSSRGLTKME